MSFLNANGVRLHVQRIGRGERTVVFLHGLVMDNLSSWYYTVANPVARFADVLLYDLRGHGLSERPRTGYSVADGVNDLAALLDGLSIERPVYLVGNSYGGLLALAFALQHPARVAGLVLVEAHYPVEGWGEHVAGTLEFASDWFDDPRVHQWFIDNKARHHDRRRFKADDLVENTSLIGDLRDQPPFTEAQLRSIACPALALYGDQSNIIDRGRALELALQQCELRVLPDSTHTILMARSREVRGHILEWMQKQPAKG